MYEQETNPLKYIIMIIVGIAAGSLLAWGFSSLTPTSTDFGTNTESTQTADYPQPTNYAVDITNTLSNTELATLNSRLKDLDTDKHQFGIAIVNTTTPLDIEAYSIELARQWQIGQEKLNNGALIILAVKDRKIRIEVGDGLAGDLNDSKVGRIIDDYMVSALKDGRWYDALIGGITGLSTNVK